MALIPQKTSDQPLNKKKRNEASQGLYKRGLIFPGQPDRMGGTENAIALVTIGSSDLSAGSAAEKTTERAAARAARKASYVQANAEVIEDADEESPGDQKDGPGLVRAAWDGKLLEVRHMLKERADPNAFEAHMGGATRLTPLMAAAAGSKVDVAAELLVAGADPDLPSASGVVAADLAENDDAGQKIGKLLAAFQSEIKFMLASPSPASPAPASPDENTCAIVLASSITPDPDAIKRLAMVARQEAVAKVAQRGLPLVEKALLGVSTICTDFGEDSDLELAGEAALRGEEAKKARKKRQTDKEAARVARVAERLAKRRVGPETEEARMKRVAEKAAARRGLDLQQEEEKNRLRRIAEKFVARREKTAAEEKKEEAKLKRLADKTKDRASAREMRAAIVAHVEQEDCEQRPVKKKVVECDVVTCFSCGSAGASLKCGKCESMGMCSVCSRCRLCGYTSGFAKQVDLGHFPGQLRYL